MATSWLYAQSPLAITVLVMIAMTLGAEVGCMLGRRWHPRTDDLRRGHLTAVLGSLLGLLALLLSFTFAMSASRYEARRQLVITDANQLATLYLQSGLLPDSVRRSFKEKLGEYVRFRTDVALGYGTITVSEARSLAAKAETLHGQLWSEVKRCHLADPPIRVADNMFRTLEEVLATQHDRMFAAESRVPDAVIWLLLLGAVAALTVIGFAGGIGNHPGHPARIALTVLLCGTIDVLLDMDRPQQGLIRVSQAPLLQLVETLQRDPEVNP